MITIKSLLWGAAFFIAGYSFTIFTSERSSYVASTSVSVPTSISKINNEPSNLLLAQCESKNAALTNHINELVKRNGNAISKIVAVDTKQEKGIQIKGVENSGEQDANSQLAVLKNYYLENEIKKHQDFLKSINATSENMPQALNDNYKKDIVDNAWSPEKKVLLDDYIAKNTFFKSLPNVESDCKSRQCKISVLTDDPTALSQLSESLGGLINNNFSHYTYTMDEKNHITSIYLDRNITN